MHYTVIADKINLFTCKPLLSVIAVLLAGFSVTFTKKLTDSFAMSYKLTGGDLMNIVVTSGLAVSTGLWGVVAATMRVKSVSQLHIKI